MKRIMLYIQLARLKHWIKNVFVLAPAIFSGRILDSTQAYSVLLAVVAFGFASSATYVFNDIWDAECDRVHPRKANRPIASGRVSKGAAVVYGTILAVAGLLAGYYISIFHGMGAFAAVAIYLVVNLFYSLRGKNMAIVDAFCIAIGFVLRVVGGAYAVSVSPTGWIIVMTFFLSLFLGFGKRRNEMLMLEEDCGTHREALRHYHIAIFDQIIVSTGTIAIISYALFTLDKSVVEKFGTDKLVYTIPFVAYGIFRYMHLLLRTRDGDPTEVVTRDKGLILTGLLWLAVVIAIIYFSGGSFR